MARTRTSLAAYYDEFVFWVHLPAQHYSFGLEHDNRVADPYSESLSLTLVADCLYPESLKGREASVTFFSRDDLTAGHAAREKRPTEPIKAVGSVRYGKDRLEVSGFLPPQAIWQLGSAIQTGLIKSMIVSGTRLKRGHVYLSYISFSGPDHDPLEHIG